MKSNVLIIDTDLENCKQIKYNLLAMTDVEVYYTSSVSVAFEKMQEREYSLVIMDVLLSTAEGIEKLSTARQINDCPLFILSEKASSSERVLGFKIGADDVLTKPYDLEECLARSLSLIHRFTENHPIGQKYVVVGDEVLMLDTAKHMVSISGVEINLTNKEYEILLYMLIHRKQVVTTNQIFDAIWNNDTKDASVVPYHVHNLRKKIGEDWIEGVYGVGYRLRDPM